MNLCECLNIYEAVFDEIFERLKTLFASLTCYITYNHFSRKESFAEVLLICEKIHLENY